MELAVFAERAELTELAKLTEKIPDSRLYTERS